MSRMIIELIERSARYAAGHYCAMCLAEKAVEGDCEECKEIENIVKKAVEYAFSDEE